MNLDAPIPPFTVPVLFVDGSKAGQTIEVDNDCHYHIVRKTGEIWYRYSEAPTGELRSFFKLKTNPPANPRTTGNAT